MKDFLISVWVDDKYSSQTYKIAKAKPSMNALMWVLGEKDEIKEFDRIKEKV